MLLQCPPYRREPVYVDQIVAHVGSYTSASGTVSASSERDLLVADNRAFQAVSRTENGVWLVQNVSQAGWIQYQLTQQKVVERYAVHADTYQYESTAVEWVFSGSNNGSDWTDLDSQFGLSWAAGETKEFDIDPSVYTYFRLSVAAILGDRVGIGEFYLYSRTP